MSISLWKAEQLGKENFALGAASRDAEIAELKREMQHYLKSAKDLLKENYDLITKREDGHLHDAEVAKLREHVTLLRDVLDDFDKAAINSKSIIGFAGQSFKLLTKMRKALAATEQKE